MVGFLLRIVVVRLPGVFMRAANGAFAILATIAGIVALFNRQLAREISDWHGFSPFWALVPFGILLGYGLFRAIHDEYAAVQKERDDARVERDRLAAEQGRPRAPLVDRSRIRDNFGAGIQIGSEQLTPEQQADRLSAWKELQRRHQPQTDEPPPNDADTQRSEEDQS